MCPAGQNAIPPQPEALWMERTDGKATHKVVLGRLAISYQTVIKVEPTIHLWQRKRWSTHLALASLTLTLGLAKSSRNRWLCSVKRRSLSSDMDCLCGREFMVVVVTLFDKGNRERGERD